MFIYEGHMGGLYVSETKLDYDQLYCDQCFDHDTFLGEANTFEEAWKILKKETNTFDFKMCDNCPHNDDDNFDFCNNECEDYMESGGYDSGYVMKFLYKNFKVDNPVYFVLLCQHVDCDNMILINCKPKGHSFGQAYEIPIVPSISKDFELPINDLLIITNDYVDDSLTKIKEIKVKETTYVFFKCLTNEQNEDWKDAAYFCDDCWYAHMDFEKVKDKLINDKTLINELSQILKEVH